MVLRSGNGRQPCPDAALTLQAFTTRNLSELVLLICGTLQDRKKNAYQHCVTRHLK